MAAAAQNALPGDALYPIKRGIETAQADLSTRRRSRKGQRPPRPGRQPARTRSRACSPTTRPRPEVERHARRLRRPGERGLRPAARLLRRTSRTRPPSTRSATSRPQSMDALAALAQLAPADLPGRARGRPPAPCSRSTSRPPTACTDLRRRAGPPCSCRRCSCATAEAERALEALSSGDSAQQRPPDASAASRHPAGSQGRRQAAGTGDDGDRERRQRLHGRSPARRRPAACSAASATRSAASPATPTTSAGGGGLGDVTGPGQGPRSRTVDDATRATPLDPLRPDAASSRAACPERSTLAASQPCPSARLGADGVSGRRTCAASAACRASAGSSRAPGRSG